LSTPEVKVRQVIPNGQPGNLVMAVIAGRLGSDCLGLVGKLAGAGFIL
jgi:hypothetical protein